MTNMFHFAFNDNKLERNTYYNQKMSHPALNDAIIKGTGLFFHRYLPHLVNSVIVNTENKCAALKIVPNRHC